MSQLRDYSGAPITTGKTLFDATGKPVQAPTGLEFVGVALRLVGTDTVTSAFSTLTFESSDLYDPWGFYDNGTSATDVVIPTGLGGIYRVNANYSLSQTVSAGAVQTLASDIQVNGSPIAGWHGYNFPSGTSTWTVPFGGVAVVLDDGDTVTLRAFRSAAGGTMKAVNVSSSVGAAFFLQKVGNV